VLGEIRNLRSQVCRQAIQTVGQLFQHCGKAMEQDLDRTSQLLLHKTADTNRFIREDSHLALMSMIDYISPPKVIVAILSEGARCRIGRSVSPGSIEAAAEQQRRRRVAGATRGATTGRH